MKYIKSLEKFLEDARMGDNFRLKGDENSDIYKIFKNGMDSDFDNNDNLIEYIDEFKLKIRWYHIEKHSIIERVINRVKSFKSVKEFNDYIILKSPIIIDCIKNIDKNGKYSFYDSEYNITLIIYLKVGDLNNIKIISVINDYKDIDVIKIFNI